jgi:hypothetical protein
MIEATREQIKAVLLEEYPDAAKLSNPIMAALLDGNELSETRPEGTNIDLNQDWPAIISTAQGLIATISALVTLAIQWKTLESTDASEDAMFDRLKSSKRGEKLLKSVGEKEVRSLIKKVIAKK